MFEGHTGDFKVFFSQKAKVPNEENGYEQKVTSKFSRVIFPLA